MKTYYIGAGSFGYAVFYDKGKDTFRVSQHMDSWDKVYKVYQFIKKL